MPGKLKGPLWSHMTNKKRYSCRHEADRTATAYWLAAELNRRKCRVWKNMTILHRCRKLNCYHAAHGCSRFGNFDGSIFRLTVVAEWYSKRLKKWIGSAVLWTRRHTFQPPIHRPRAPQLTVSQTDSQTDRRQYDANSLSYCVQYDRLGQVSI